MNFREDITLLENHNRNLLLKILESEKVFLEYYKDIELKDINFNSNIE